MGEQDWTTAGLWLAVIAAGVYHGANPGMGWPLAVSAALMGKGRRDLFRALGPLAAGHFMAMAAMLAPFAAMTALIAYQRELRVGAALIVIGFGLYLLANRRHPRILARIPPTRLAFWSFLVATAHGAGLMLLPIYLGLCRAEDLDTGHRAASSLMGGNVAMAVAVSFVHALAMITTGGALAYAVHRYLGLKFLSKSWFNLDVVWAASLVLVGGIALMAALAGSASV